ncbi:hypothetical protein A6033_18165 [Aeromonas veronii]|nr:hypothetical protein A6033_18165 [Aeromonas veronii]
MSFESFSPIHHWSGASNILAHIDEIELIGNLRQFYLYTINVRVDEYFSCSSNIFIISEHHIK